MCIHHKNFISFRTWVGFYPFEKISLKALRNYNGKLFFVPATKIDENQPTFETANFETKVTF